MSAEETLPDDDDPLTPTCTASRFQRREPGSSSSPTLPDGSATDVVAPLVDWFAREDRAARASRPSSSIPAGRAWAKRWRHALDQATLPLVLITTATGAMGRSTCFPLLEAIDHLRPCPGQAARRNRLAILAVGRQPAAAA